MVDLKLFISTLLNEDKFNIINNDENEFLKLLEKTYSNDMKNKHLYSEIFPILISYHKDENGENENLTLIETNLNALYRKYKTKKENYDEIWNKFFKLYDHIILEIRRIQFFDKENILTNKEIDSLKELSKQYLEDSNTQKKYIDKLEKEYNAKINDIIKESKLDLISTITGVLSIFTIFGVNYTIIKDSFILLLKDNPVKLFLVWSIFNLGLLFIIRMMFSAIKEYFGTYDRNINYEFTKIVISKNTLILILILILSLFLLA